MLHKLSFVSILLLLAGSCVTAGVVFGCLFAFEYLCGLAAWAIKTVQLGVHQGISRKGGIVEHRYTRRGTTWKPCPACGEEPKTSYKVGSICDECSQALEWARHERLRYDKLQGLEARTLPSDPSRIRLGYCPGSSSSQSKHHKEFDAAQEEIARGIFALLEVLSFATGGAAEIACLADNGFRFRWARIPSGDDGYHPEERHRRLLIQPEYSDLIDRIGPNLIILIRCAYESGLIDGKSLLAQLANGEITLDKLAEADQQAAKAIQESLTRLARMKS